MAASSFAPPQLLEAADQDVEITIVSAKHLKNVNWRNGPLIPYAAVYLGPNPSPNHRFSTVPDDSNSTRPVWNERFMFPYSSFSSLDSILAVDVFHSRHSETSKPLVGTLRVTAASLLPDFSSPPWIIHSLDLLRPSGRPQGKIRVKITLRRRDVDPAPSALTPTPGYNFAPEVSYHYSSVSPGNCSAFDFYPPPPPPPPPGHIRPFSQPLTHSPLTPSNFRVAPPPPPPSVRAFGIYPRDRNSDVDSVYRPSAPVDFTYPAKECEPCRSPRPDFCYTDLSPLPDLSSSNITYTGTLPHWSSSRSVLWSNELNSVSLERDRWVAPPVPTGIYRRRRGLEEGSVTGAFGGLRLNEVNNAHRRNYACSDGYGGEE